MTRSRTWPAAMVAVLALTALATVAAPSAEAYKGRECIRKPTVSSFLDLSKTVDEFDTPGFNTDVDLTLCIMYDHSRRGYWAAATGQWTDGGGKRKFDRFDLKIGVQRNQRTVLARTYGLARRINGATSGPINEWAQYYRVRDQGRGGAYTADAVVTYDIEGDGKGSRRWHLPGSPRIR